MPHTCYAILTGRAAGQMIESRNGTANAGKDAMTLKVTPLRTPPGGHPRARAWVPRPAVRIRPRSPGTHATDRPHGKGFMPQSSASGPQPRIDDPLLDLTPGLDEKSKTIIEQLQQNGRSSYSHIARVVGLSEAAVRQRVAKLLDEQVIKIVAVTNPLQVGFPRQAMVQIKADSDLLGTADRLAAIPEVDYCVVTSGRWDIIAELVCEDDDHLLRVLSRIRQTDGVQETDTLTYLSLRKQEYDWGTR